jgi:hypothetical protein
MERGEENPKLNNEVMRTSENNMINGYWMQIPFGRGRKWHNSRLGRAISERDGAICRAMSEPRDQLRNENIFPLNNPTSTSLPIDNQNA